MATNPAVRRARRSLVGLLVIFVALIGVITIGVVRHETDWTPKLALDLQGGTQILLAAKQSDGQAVSGDQLEQAVAIIRQRVNASGVSEAEISTQGAQNISVSIPGKADAATLQRIEASAQLEFRAVLTSAPATYENPPAEQPDANDGAQANNGDSTAQANGSSDGASSQDAPADGASSADTNADDSPTDTPAPAKSDDGLYPNPLPTSPYDPAWMTDALKAEFSAFNCNSDAALSVSEAPSDRPLITCSSDGSTKFILGAVELSGSVITDAVSQPYTTQTGATTGEWTVQLTMNQEGANVFGKISQRMYGAPSPSNQFAFVLDGKVLSAPTMNAQILDGRPSITGGFTQDSAKALADQLKFGALPIGFTVQSQEDISATLGSNQLQAGLLAGLIGLLLVVVYSLFQYRVLGLLTVASLVVAGALTYLMLVLLSWRQGYRLSLAGVAGVIVAVGITADSFIVYFERIRDALRDGFSLERAVESGWKKAIRTVLASDGINFLAAAILFILAIGSVRGFAFTLGLTTIIDVLVVALFTHPMMALLARTRFYHGGHRFSGLDPDKLGAVYRGRAQFREPVVVTRGAGVKNSGARKEAQRRQTIAERKQAESASTRKES